jgi:hypothetical protein
LSFLLGRPFWQLAELPGLLGNLLGLDLGRLPSGLDLGRLPSGLDLGRLPSEVGSPVEAPVGSSLAVEADKPNFVAAVEADIQLELRSQAEMGMPAGGTLEEQQLGEVDSQQVEEQSTPEN